MFGKKIAKVNVQQAIDDGFEMQGLFLYEKKDCCYFKKGFNNLLSYNTNPLNDQMFKFWEAFEERYLKKLFWSCGKSTYKPSLLCFNDFLVQFDSMDKLLGVENQNDYKTINLNLEDEESFEEEIELINEKPCIFHAGNKDDFSKTLEALVEKRNEVLESNDEEAFANLRDVIVFISDPQELDLDEVKKFLSLGNARKIYFIISIMDKAKFVESTSEGDFNALEKACPTKIIWQGTKIKKLRN